MNSLFCIFSMFYFLAWIVRLIRVKYCSCSPTNQENDLEMNSVDDKNYQYWKTLERLIQTKIDLDFEHSPHGDYNELRDDMKNMIVKEFKKRDKKDI